MPARAAGTRTPARQSRPSQPLGAPPRSAAEAAAQRTQARSPAAPPGPDADEAMDPGVTAFEPVRLTKARRKGPEVTLFYVDDEPFQVSALPRMDIGLEAIEIAMTHPLGQIAAERYVFIAMLGKDGYAAFRASVETPEDYQKVAAILSRLTIGAVESPKE